MSDETEHNEFSVEIEREKTKRTYAWMILFGIIAVLSIALFFQNVEVGSFSFTKDGVSLTMDKRLMDQVVLDTTTVESNGESVILTSGTISDSVVSMIEVERSEPIKSDEFVGKNLIDRKNGFVLSSDLPGKWSVDKRVSTADGKVLAMRAGKDASLTVQRVPVSETKPPTVKMVVDSLIRSSDFRRDALGRPTVTYDKSKTTALIVYKSRSAGGDMYIKVTQGKKSVYVARAKIADEASKKVRSDAIKAVTSFTLIE